jgi:3-hydroxyacyl-[acyl-carrier-protein] dehydratase
MLLNDFYFITQQSSELLDHGKRKIQATLSLNKSHPIFAGHFPGQPIVPGVCMVQMVKEVLEIEVGKKLVLASAGNIKFLSMLMPNKNIEVYAEILFVQNSIWYEVEGKLDYGDVVFFKLKGSFLKIE